MLICSARVCACFHHRLLECIKNGENDEANYILKNIQNFCNLADTSGSTLVHYSAKHGNSEVVQALIYKGCKINAQDSSGVTPLMLAVQKKHVTTVEVLLKNNADIFVTDNNQMSGLHLAAYFRLYSSDQNSHLILDKFLDKIKKDLSTNKQKTTRLLVKANDLAKLSIVVFGDIHLAGFVLKNGYMLEYREYKGRTALGCAILYVKIENIKLLIEHRANINAVNQCNGCMPIQYYTVNFEAKDENSETLKYLLEHAIGDVSLSDRTKRTDIEHLLTHGKEKTVRTVLQMGIDGRGCFPSGKYLIHLLCIENKNAGVFYLLDEFNIEFDANALTSDGFTALHLAVYSGCLRKVEFLLKHGADVNARAATGPSVLIYALTNSSQQGYYVARIVKLLLQRGADAQFIHDRYIVESLRDRRNETNVAIAHLAMLGALVDSPFTDFIRSQIDSDAQFAIYFDVCTRQLEMMKKHVVHGWVTMFHLLTESDEKVMGYLRNRELFAAVDRIMKNMYYFESSYCSAVRTKIESSRNRIELDRKAALALEALTGLSSDSYHNVVYKILNYLNLRELQNLCESVLDCAKESVIGEAIDLRCYFS